MARRLLIVFGGVFAVMAGVVVSREGHVVVERKQPIAAPRDLAFSYLEDLRRWAEWSASEKLDPAMTRTFEGAKGVGAKYAWAGNAQVGAGRMTVTESRPPELLRLELELLEPYQAKNPVTFELAAVGDATVVTWRTELTRGLTDKAMSLVMDVDKSAGGDLEKGLAELKFVVESEAARRSPPPVAPGEPDVGAADGGSAPAPAQ